AITYSRDLLARKKDELGVPGVVVAVSVDGETLWAEGLGYADMENRVPCGRHTVMRIGSISKPITMMALAKLMEEGKVDLDKPIQEYVPSFPQKTYNGKPVSVLLRISDVRYILPCTGRIDVPCDVSTCISSSRVAKSLQVVLTLRHLVSHLGGIRHYKVEKKDEEAAKKGGISDDASEEFFLNRKFKTMEEALELFKNDALLSEPGTKYFYTTFGWTLISAAIEGASKETFPKHISKMFKTIGMKNSYLDENEPIIYHRSRFYVRNQNGCLTNSPCVDSSYKWAGGGLLSNVDDLVLFGNAMLYSAQADPSHKSGYLLADTVRALWTPHERSRGMWSRSGRYDYGMGWILAATAPGYGGCAEELPFVAYHGGSSIGGTSALVVLPNEASKWMTAAERNRSNDLPRGVVVAVIGNLSNADYKEAALSIAREFAKLAS
ncbi:conserved hypothetical protein, partial [Ixodes scapularis]